MRNKTLFLFLAFMSIATIAYTANAEEEITLSTYYPAPYGEYDQLKASRLAIGNSASMPTPDGVANFATIAEPASTVSAVGDMYFNGSEFKYYKSATDGWKSFGGAASDNILTNQWNFDLSSGTGSLSQEYSKQITVSGTSERIAIVYCPSVAINMGSLGHIKGIIKLFIDGIAVNSCECRHTSSWYNNNGSISWTQTLGPGNHTIKVNAYITDGDGSFSGSGAFIIIRNAVSM